MKTDMKIGILVGIVIVAILLIFFVKRDSKQSDQPMVTVTVPSPPVQTSPPAPKPEPVAKPVQSPVTVAPEPQPKPKVILPVRSEPVELQPQPTPSPAPAPIVPQPEPIRKPRYHTVGEGDSLSTISQAYYGSGKFWTEIQKANRHRIQNPNHLQVGWKLRIPYPDEIAPTP